MGYDIRKNEKLRLLSRGGGMPLYASAIGVSFPDERYRVRRKMSRTTVVEYIIDGEGYVLMNGSMHKVQKGQAYVLPAGIPHDYYSSEEAPLHKIWINYHGNLPSRLLCDYGIDKWLFDGESLYYIFERVVDLLSSDISDIDCQRILAGLYMELLVGLQQICKNAKHSPEAVKIKEFLDANIHRTVSNSEIASLTFRSIDYCIKLFKSEYGSSPYDYHLTRRLRLACSMLEQTSMEIAAIAEDVGFEDAHYFSRLFKQKYGVTPKQYRSNSHKQ